MATDIGPTSVDIAQVWSNLGQPATSLVSKCLHIQWCGLARSGPGEGHSEIRLGAHCRREQCSSKSPCHEAPSRDELTPGIHVRAMFREGHQSLHHKAYYLTLRCIALGSDAGLARALARLWCRGRLGRFLQGQTCALIASAHISRGQSLDRGGTCGRCELASRATWTRCW